VGLVEALPRHREKRYLDLARHFLDQRGRPEGRELYGSLQPGSPAGGEQHEGGARGARHLHVPAMADRGSPDRGPGYVAAIDRLWEDVVGRKLYLTGGIGRASRGRELGDAYELPTGTPTPETSRRSPMPCEPPAVSSSTGMPSYLDVLER